MDCLHKLFLFDTQKFLSKERAETLMLPLVDQVFTTQKSNLCQIFLSEGFKKQIQNNKPTATSQASILSLHTKGGIHSLPFSY